MVVFVVGVLVGVFTGEVIVVLNDDSVMVVDEGNAAELVALRSAGSIGGLKQQLSGRLKSVKKCETSMF
ncbi:MAG: hypothetical protein EZS28_011099 [Streblomastix strix]|uniref:Uncharacterized protein n=1 Tax=Streblomastix strix TaxID=222440 RepID=A0A5J4WEH9_9EUKA|nr:MAG: hypothetical protein EZS28_011099 [Streblomastix strix]